MNLLHVKALKIWGDKGNINDKEKKKKKLTFYKLLSNMNTLYNQGDLLWLS